MHMRALLIPTLAAGTLLAAQERELPRPAVVRATGETTVRVRPDQTRVRIGVVTRAGKAERAAAKNAETTTEVIRRVREILGPDADVRTANYSLTSFTGNYVANNTIEVHVHDPANMGKVIDAVTKSGANVISGLESSALDEQDARKEALKQATERARANAEAIAAALGLRVIRVAAAETAQPASTIGGGNGRGSCTGDGYAGGGATVTA